MAKTTAAVGDNRREVISSPDDVRLQQLREEFDFALNQRDSNIFSRLRQNYEARMCVWPNQSDDGRKWYARDNEEEVFPWEGASDARVNLVDKYVKQDVDFLMVLWHRMKTAVNGVEVNDEAWARRMTWFLRWMKYSQMKEAPTENELLANYLLERGSAVMGVFWNKQQQMGYEEIDLETLAVKLAQMGQRQQTTENTENTEEPNRAGGLGVELIEKIFNPEFEAEAAADLAQLYPDVPAGRMVRVVRELRLQGYSRFPRPTVLKNRPRVFALAPNEDVFLSPDAVDLEDAQVHWVETMREAKLRERAETYEWAPAWTEAMVTSQRGQVSYGPLLFNHRFQLGLTNLSPNRGYLDTKKLFLVVHSYRRLVDADGVPGIYYTVWNPNLVSRAGGEELYARHELLNYDHGQVPFVLLRREMRSRRVDDARGYGEIASTWQNQIKAEWDSRIDRASISTLPPSHYPPGQAPDKWGPGVQVPTSVPERYGFFSVPNYDPGSREVEQSVRNFADDYFGFLRDPEHALDSQNNKQRLADRWMRGQVEIDTQILQLCQQFMPDDFYFRVVGSAKGRPIHATREDIQGQFDLGVGFNVQDMDPALVQKKLELLGQVLAFDVGGAADRTEAMVVAFEMMDPNLGERLLRSPEEASLAEVEDEKTVFVKLLAGVTQDVKPGQAFRLRLQTLQNLLQTNQTAQEIFQNNEQARKALEYRLKQLALQVQQQQNAVIGRGGPMFAAKPKTS